VIVLGLDTSGYTNAVGIVNDNKVLADRSFPAKTDSLEQIVANIDDVLKGAGLTIEKVDGIGVGLGPGSWTGIRVGVTVGKMLAFAAGKPVAGISTLESLAYAVEDHSRLMCSIISVGAGDAVYAGLYRRKEGEIFREGDYFVGSVSGLSLLIKEPSVIVGKGVSSYAEAISRASSKNVIVLETQPSGAVVAGLSEKRLALGKSDDALSLTPLYLKESTAKVFVNKYRSGKRTG
jgi:tRNA threonylcarbamoyladenosine biosynthesis protein TsaB